MTLERRPSGRRQADADLDARHAAQLRALNLDRVLRFAMSRAAAFTRTEAIEATGLSAPTVGTLCSHLIRSGVLSDLGAGPRAADAVRRSWNSTRGTRTSAASTSA
jgi:hypothetical protein